MRNQPEMQSSEAFSLGRLQVSLASDAQEMHEVQVLRAQRFRGQRGVSDLDAFDRFCQHLLVRDEPAGSAVAAARLRVLSERQDMASSYTAQFYDLTHLGAQGMRLLEIGRICIAEDRLHDPDIMRALLAGLTRHAVAARADILMGCASFAGADPSHHTGALAHLAANHVGPVRLRPRRRDALAVALPSALSDSAPDGAKALRGIPPLLRMYLGMGGWVSDHAVCDMDLDTLHVFAAVETARIPPARLRVLQALARG